jgi:hypothetical protein
MIQKTYKPRILSFPAEQSPIGGRIDSLLLKPKGRNVDLVLEYHELVPAAEMIHSDQQGKLFEKIEGHFLPRKLLFSDAQIIHGEQLASILPTIPEQDPSRMITGALAWRTHFGEKYYLFDFSHDKNPSLLFLANRCTNRMRPGLPHPASFVRDWSPAPLSPARIVPEPVKLRQKYGGDPITIHLNGYVYHHRLFIGDVEVQSENRPDIHTVLNIGEEPSRWAATTPPNPSDRWDEKGEGSQGMTVSDITEEAHWVIDRLKSGERVLVHCAAGMNRSATICCAVLVLLEGISAQNALERVRTRHPWARPDSHHWLALKWLAENKKRPCAKSV